MAENELQSRAETNLEDISNDDFERALESVPEENRRIIERFVFSSIQMRDVSSPESFVMKQITPEHITKYLDGAEQEMKNSYKEQSQRKIFTLITVLAIMAFLIAIIIILKDNPDVMEKIIYAAGGVIAGAFGGYGLGIEKGKKDS